MELAVSHPVVQKSGQVRIVEWADVPDDEPAGPVDGQVNRVHGETLAMGVHVGLVTPEGHGKGDRTGEKQPAAWRLGFPGRSLRAGEDRSHLANHSGLGYDSVLGGEMSDVHAVSASP